VVVIKVCGLASRLLPLPSSTSKLDGTKSDEWKHRREDLWKFQLETVRSSICWKPDVTCLLLPICLSRQYLLLQPCSPPVVSSIVDSALLPLDSFHVLIGKVRRGAGQ